LLLKKSSHGRIVTNGYSLTLICRYLEQGKWSISGFSKEERPFDLQPSQIGAPEAAPKNQKGVNGINGDTGIRGMQEISSLVLFRFLRE
jgi:hypothetical protein